MDTGYTTIITPIKRDEEEALRQYLRSEIEPRYNRDTIVECKDAFRFDEIRNLHFCSFIILKGDEDEKLPPYLVFEATFDGPRDFFLDALLHHAGNAIHEIYQHCEGYPVSGREAPNLIKEYLAAHDTGAHTFFRGNPGRTVEQVKGEARIYNALVKQVGTRWRSAKPMPTTFAGLQQELQRVIRKGRATRWAEQLAAIPWEVAQRKVVVVAAGMAAFVVACTLGALILWLLFGLGPSNVYHEITDYVRALGQWLFGHSNLIWHPLPLFALLAAWLIVRYFELILQYEDPREKSRFGAHFWLWYRVLLLHILRYALFVTFALFAALLLDPSSNLDPAFANWFSSFQPCWLYVLLLLVGAIIIFLQLRYAVTSLKLVVELKELEQKDENFRSLLIDLLRVGMVIVGVFAAFIISRVLPGWLNSILIQFVSLIARGTLILAAYTFVGVIILYSMFGGVFLLIRAKERRDSKRFANAKELTTVDNSGVYAREEGGTNIYQNFLASLTYVKPGLFSIWSLRLTLFLIELLARFWYNMGNLGDITTILSARWVIIDDGKRLLFLDHYSGAWDSYLNEFIDMGAVKGLNAIWTNTFVKAGQKNYGFPETEYRFWGGAQVEKPFKAYVRQSQIETIVWYSAYPTLATVNIDIFTYIRQSLFKSLDACEIDSLLQNL